MLENTLSCIQTLANPDRTIKPMNPPQNTGQQMYRCTDGHPQTQCILRRVERGTVLTGGHHTVGDAGRAHWLELDPGLAVGVVQRTHAAHCCRRR